MKIVLAPDSFKESLTAREVCIAMEKGFKQIFPEAEYMHVPMADGGEGTVQSLVDATGGQIMTAMVTGPLGEPRAAAFGILGDKTTAVIEMAQASGLELLPREQRNPLITTTFGTGELIKAALDQGVKTILIGIGGSATNDGGAGMIQALGGHLKDSAGAEIGFGGGALKNLRTIDITGLDPRLAGTEVITACDVTNPLTGEFGASAIFGPQKGATPAMVRELDEGLQHFARIIRETLGKEIETVPGSGAAGGLGGGLLGFLNTELKRGIDMVISYTQLPEKMAGADLVLTGEGGMDAQTRFGKAPYGVAATAKKFGIPVIALAGNVKADSRILFEHGFDAIFPITQGAMSLPEALAKGRDNVQITAENIARVIHLFKQA